MKESLELLKNPRIDSRAKKNLALLLQGAATGIEVISYNCASNQLYTSLNAERYKIFEALGTSKSSKIEETEEEGWDLVKDSSLTASPYAKTAQGPTLLGKIYSLAATFMEWSTAAPSQIDKNLPEGLQKLMKPGIQLPDSSSDILMAWLKKAKGISFIQEGTFRNKRDILSRTPESVERTLKRAVKEYEANPKLPVVIPIVLAKGSFFEAGHIITLIIKDGVLYCYDPKGEASSNHQLQNQEGTLRDRLEHIGRLFNVDFVQENFTNQQLNIHQCGRHNLFYCYEVLTGNIPLNGMENKPVSSASLTEFGMEIGRELIDYWQNNSAFRNSLGYE